MNESHDDGETGGKDRAEKLAGGTIEIVSTPAVSARSVSGELSAVRIGGEGSAGQISGSNGVTGLARIAVGTGGVLAVGDGKGTGTRSVGSNTGGILLAKAAISNTGGGGGLLSSWELAVGNSGGAGWDGGSARRGVIGSNTTGLVDDVMLGRTTASRAPGPVGSVGVGAGIVLGVSRNLGQGSSACVGSKRSGTDFT